MATGPISEALTDREREVLDLMARGLTNGQIAERLDIGFETAKTHVSRIIAKTGAETREEAVANYRIANRPAAKVRRMFSGWWGVPAIRIGWGIAGVAAVAVLGLGVWYAAQDEPAADPGPVVRYFEREANSSEGIDIRIPFAEAIERQEEAVGHAAPVLADLGDLELVPQFVEVTLPRELTRLPEVTGITRWSVWYGDGPTEDSNTLQIGIVRNAQVEQLDPATECDLPNTVAGDWATLTTPNGRFEVLTRQLTEDDFMVYITASCFGTELRVTGSDLLPQAEALAILESVLEQE